MSEKQLEPKEPDAILLAFLERVGAPLDIISAEKWIKALIAKCDEYDEFMEAYDPYDG
jgi:hypothetical protein